MTVLVIMYVYNYICLHVCVGREIERKGERAKERKGERIAGKKDSLTAIVTQLSITYPDKVTCNDILCQVFCMNKRAVVRQW